MTFLALLELMKVGKIHLTQEHLFDDMCIESLEPEGEEEDIAIDVTLLSRFAHLLRGTVKIGQFRYQYE